jgi:hypothetical protein
MSAHRQYRFIEKEFIGQGSLIQLFTVLQRSQGTTDLNNVLPTEQFTPVADVGTNGNIMGRVESINPVSRFAGVDINGFKATHILWTNWDNVVFQLGVNSLFIDVEYPEQNRRFKILSIEDYSELQKFIKMYATDRGFSTVTAASI